MILVAVNDITAYCCGKLFGKHKLIILSPSKTWEGYIGALFCTTALSPLVFRVIILSLPDIDHKQLCMTILLQATWISIVGPFGGLFGSLVKRSIGIKDFGNIIPGHGGAVDRWDC